MNTHTLTVDNVLFTLKVASLPGTRAPEYRYHLSNHLAVASEFRLLRGWTEELTQWT
jgi:hypothetical protein